MNDTMPAEVSQTTPPKPLPRLDRSKFNQGAQTFDGIEKLKEFLKELSPERIRETKDKINEIAQKVERAIERFDRASGSMEAAAQTLLLAAERINGGS